MCTFPTKSALSILSVLSVLRGRWSTESDVSTWNIRDLEFSGRKVNHASDDDAVPTGEMMDDSAESFVASPNAERFFWSGRQLFVQMRVLLHVNELYGDAA